MIARKVAAVPTDKTPVTDHVHACVKLLNKALQTTNPSTPTFPQPMRDAFEAVFELVELPWDEGTEQDLDFREGYEMALQDIVEAIAQAWKIELPPLKVKKT